MLDEKAVHSPSLAIATAMLASLIHVHSEKCGIIGQRSKAGLKAQRTQSSLSASTLDVEEFG